MAKVLVVTSGKGGVGKTTSTAALGAALAQMGEKVVVIDFDVGLRNLDLVMGAERRIVFDLINVVQGVAKLSQALIRDKRLENLWLLPASATRDKDALTDEGVGNIIAELRNSYDWILCDSPAGVERGALLAMRYADEAVIVTNPEVSSVRNSTASLECSIQRQSRPSEGSKSRNICSSRDMIQPGHYVAKCSASTISLKFSRRRCSESFLRARTFCVRQTLGHRLP